MKRRTKQWLALLGGAVLLTLAWPGPSSAQTSLGGYAATAQSDPIHVQIYEPALPLPSNPQVDVGIGYTKAHTDTGPASRATASYLWPGDVLGDGFGQLVGNNATYPVQVNSRYPATASAPEHNAAQLTDGNGMTTSSTETATTASVTGLGVAGPDTNLLSGIGKGLGQLAGNNKPTPQLPELPVPVSKTLAGLMTLQNMHSESSVVLGDKTVTATAHTAMSAIKLLAGLITIDGLDIQSQTVSNGTTATATGTVNSLVLSIAGQKLALTDKGIEVAGSKTALPGIPDAISSLLGAIGISIDYAPSTRSVQGPTGSFSTAGLAISIDTVPLKKALNLGGLIAPLRQLVEKIPTLGDQLGPLLGIGPKIVFTLGDVTTSATAAPAFTGGVGGGGGTTGGGTTGSGSGPVGGSGGTPGGTGIGPVQNPPPATGGSAPAIGATQPTALNLPGLGSVPRALVVGLLLAALAVGWGLRLAGAFVLGTGGSCVHGLATGVPDLRKG